MNKPKGKLIAVGGNEDKGSYPTSQSKKKYYLDFFELGILKRFLAEIPVERPRIEVVTSASLIPEEVGERYQSAFGILGCEEIGLMHIKEAAEAHQPANLERLRQADGIMFSGGDQSRLTRFFSNSPFLDILVDRYTNEDFVIAGTSAGAMAMSEIMIRGGSAKESLLKGSVRISQGLGLMGGVIIDSHFIIRGRFGRLMEAVVSHPKTVGIGLGEDTGVLITGGHLIETIGSNLVVIIDGHVLGYSNISEIERGKPVAIENMLMHVLAKGNIYDIDSRVFYKDKEALQLAQLKEQPE
ncbi:cyanophycinase [Pontibacter qinzhouensis]|uniref:Cyanophycinase n=1 Tax=Pontibacter qinzhouensis TaxID=2603253 RepID=A0A5C8KAC4_9BACT|nr:cyanophycinase [Pontibacter qinzhouensis]TXK45802.1 cyanophycinase [Pontibacter qinzhouensis]